MSNRISDIRALMEQVAEADYKGPIEHPDVSYSSVETKGEITKVVAHLQSYQSGRYTKLGRNLHRVERLEARIKQIKEEAKGEAKELIADLFNAEDAARTRVVETVSFTFQLTKDPKATESVQYAKVLKELEDHLTPELVQVMESLKAKYSSTVQKSPALSATDNKATEGFDLNEGVWDQMKAFFAKFVQQIQSWGKSYDAKLAALKASVGVSEAVEEAASEDAFDDIYLMDGIIEAFENDHAVIGRSSPNPTRDGGQIMKVQTKDGEFLVKISRA